MKRIFMNPSEMVRRHHDRFQGYEGKKCPIVLPLDYCSDVLQGTLELLWEGGFSTYMSLEDVTLPMLRPTMRAVHS